METAAHLAETSNEPALTPAQQAALAREVFRISFRGELTSLENFKPFRTRVAWRVIREMGRLKGKFGGEEFISEGLEPDYGNNDPWTHPEEFKGPNIRSRSGANGLITVPPEVYKAFWDSQQLAEENYPNYKNKTPDLAIQHGFAYLPPDIPKKYIDDLGRVSALYNPQEDVLLNQYLTAFNWVAHYLRIVDGSADDRTQGRYGLTGLQDAKTVRHLFPSRYEIMVWERMIIEETSRMLITLGMQQTRLNLELRYGLQAHETTSLVKLAKAWIRASNDADLEDEKALMHSRLDDLAGRAREACDLRTELMTLKQAALILGMSRTVTGDEMDDFINVVRKVSQEKKATHSRVIESTEVPMLEG
jgi:hypothetical protein